MRHLSIKFKLLLLTLIALAPLVLLEAYNINGSSQKRTEQKLQESLELSQVISKSFVNYIEDLWFKQFIIGEHIMDNINDIDEINEYLTRIVNSKETIIKRASWVSPQGITLTSTDKELIGQSLLGREYFKKILSGDEKALSNLVEGMRKKEIIIPVARAIKIGDKLLGVVICIVDVEKLVKMMPNVRLNEGDVLSLIDSNGYVVYNNITDKMSFEDRLIPESSPVWEAFKGQQVKTYNHKSEIDGEIRMEVAYPIKEFGWAVTVSSKRNVVLKDIHAQNLRFILTLVLAAIVSLGAAIVFGHKIAEPLINLKKKAEEIKQGNYSVRTDITGSDEIAATAEAFNLMAESIEHYDSMKNQFFINLSHELKTPINVIYSCVQLMESLKNSTEPIANEDKNSKNIKVIKQNCFRLMRLIGNLIDTAKFENGYLTLKPSNHDIVSLVEDISLSVVRFAEQKNITIIFDTDVEEKVISCDGDMIERIMLNLISNSLKFTDEGGFIYINLYDEGEKVKISVKDTGIGIPEDKLQIIFDRFRQVDSSLNRNQEGSGLGLSIVKALVGAHGGSITVESDLTMGSKFIVELPAKLLNDALETPREHGQGTVKETVQKIAVEFSDIYSIEQHNL